jgi:sulfoxide reductase heme-binding subunit YedZ
MKHSITLIKAMIILACVSHFVYLAVSVVNNTLGANPIEVLTHVTGEWGLRLLLITLAITPLRRLLGWNRLMRFRRLLGVCSFTYILAHFAIFLIFDHLFDVLSIIDDIVERPYITVGFIAFVMMVPLAVTSLSVLQRKMGKYWVKLHQLVYVVAILAVVHYWWLVKADILLPAIYAAIVFLLLAIRLYYFADKKGYLMRLPFARE